LETNTIIYKQPKRYVRYKEGAELYSIGVRKFQELAKDAKAVCRLPGGKIVLVDTRKLEAYLECFTDS
jgi:hypothetical protein